MPNSSQTLRIRLHLLPQFCHAKSALQSLASHNPPLLPHNILAPACFPVHWENCFATRKSPGVSCIRIRCFSHIFQPDTSDFHAQVAYLHSELPLRTLFIYHCLFRIPLYFLMLLFSTTHVTYLHSQLCVSRIVYIPLFI